MSYDFTELDKAVRNWARTKPTIKIACHDISTGCQVNIYADINEQVTDLDYRDLERYIKWAANQLKNWHSVFKTDYNTWIFASRRDAEKFATLFSLYQSR